MLKHVPRLHLRANALIFVFFSGLLWLSLPYDNKLVLIVRWHFNAVTGAMTPNDRWISESPPFHIGTDDVAMLIKTGFSTQERLAAKLKAISNPGSPRNIVLVGDYSTPPGSHFSCNGIEVPVHNALAWMINRENISPQLNVSRIKYYSELTSAIAAGDRELALSIGETHGWELDIIKAGSILTPFCFRLGLLISVYYVIVEYYRTFPIFDAMAYYSVSFLYYTVCLPQYSTFPDSSLVTRYCRIKSGTFYWTTTHIS